MSWSVKIGSIAGTAVRIHITFILFLAWIFGASYVSGGPNAAWSSLLFMVLLFLCVLAHEFGHILTARAFGVLTPDVILLPIGGVARLERIPEKPLEEFLIAIAGPLVNVVIAFGLVLVTSATLDGGSLATVESAKVSMVDRLASVNLFLALFNLIPAFPMDGGRILRALLSARLRARHRDRRDDRPMGRIRARLHRSVREPDADLHRDLRLSGGLLGGPYGCPPLLVARRSGRRRDDDAIRDAHAGIAHRRGDRAPAAHQPERIPDRRSCAAAGRYPVPRRPHPRSEGARPRGPREGRDIVALPDLRPSLHAGRRAQAPAGKGRARSRRARWCGPAGRARELRNARRNADDRGRHAAWIPPGQRPPARRRLKG